MRRIQTYNVWGHLPRAVGFRFLGGRLIVVTEVKGGTERYRG
jgi:hypothetical protein